MAKKETSLDDKTIEEFYKLGQEIRELPNEKYVKSLKGILHEEASKYFHAKKDKETHELKWESDEQLKGFTGSLWDKAADHIAQNYLKMGAEEVKALKGKKDPDSPDQTLFESFMTQYLGTDKEGFFDAMKVNPTMDPENLLGYIQPLYQQHLKIRVGKKLTHKLKTNEDAANLLKYVSLMKEHNPKAVKMRVPTQFKSIDETARLYQQALEMVPDTYHPKKPDTYKK